METLSVGDGLRVSEKFEHYLGFVVPGRGGFERGGMYRLRVVAGGSELGHVDVTVVRRAREAREVYRTGGVPMFERAPFPIRFRIEDGLVTKVKVEPESASVEAGKSSQLSATVFDARGEEFSGREISWESDAPDVASVDADGVVAGISEGTATVTASVDGVSDSASVDVAAPPPPPEDTYYVSNDGSDENTGLSPEEAWRTVAKVNGVSFDPGDTALFEGGGVWREMLQPRSSGTADAPITFGGYGEGRPVLDGGEGATGFTGINAGNISDVVFEGFEVRNRPNDMLVYLAGAEDVVFENLRLHDARAGVHATGSAPSSGIAIRDSKIEDTFARDADGGAIGGIGINVNDGSSGWKISDTEVAGAGDSCVIDRGRDNTYERVNVHRCGYSPITFGAHGLYLKGPGHELLDSEVWDVKEYLANSRVSVRYEDVRIQGNRIHGCYGGLEVFDETSVPGVVTIRRNEFWDNFNAVYVDGSHEQTVRISNNTILGTRKNASGTPISRAIYVSDSPGATAPVPGLHVENNIVTGDVSIPLFVRVGANTEYVERHNVYHSTGSMNFWWAGGPRTFEVHKTLSGQGANSVVTNPMLVSADPSEPDFALQSTSPIIDTGLSDPASGALSPGCDGGPDSYCGDAPDPGSREYIPE
ncbi:MAG: right-handed parallel beta-helix repeat-containing protein [Rubrobacter sp.]|nr:right-handed parallel beta-helix repeat-containing protein [Rubrobacter sp.]